MCNKTKWTERFCLFVGGNGQSERILWAASEKPSNEILMLQRGQQEIRISLMSACCPETCSSNLRWNEMRISHRRTDGGDKVAHQRGSLHLQTLKDLQHAFYYHLKRSLSSCGIIIHFSHTKYLIKYSSKLRKK